MAAGPAVSDQGSAWRAKGSSTRTLVPALSVRVVSVGDQHLGEHRRGEGREGRGQQQGASRGEGERGRDREELRGDTGGDRRGQRGNGRYWFLRIARHLAKLAAYPVS